MLTGHGLSLREVDRRRDEYDPNAHNVRHRATAAGMLLNQLMNSTIITLILASAFLVANGVIVLDDSVAAEAVKGVFHGGEV